MIVCRKCAKENPDHLQRCPQCGGALHATSRTFRPAWLVVAVVAISAATAGLLWLRRPEVQTEVRSEAPKPDRYAVFRTAGKPSFHGLKLTFEYPSSFFAEPSSELERGWEFKPDKNSHRDTIAALVATVPKALGQTEALELLRDPRAQEGIAPGSTNWKVQAVDGLALPCAVLEYDNAVPGMPALRSQCRNYVFFVDHRMLHLLFSRIAPRAERPLDEWADLMDRVVHSVRTE